MKKYAFCLTSSTVEYSSFGKCNMWKVKLNSFTIYLNWPTATESRLHCAKPQSFWLDNEQTNSLIK